MGILGRFFLRKDVYGFSSAFGAGGVYRHVLLITAGICLVAIFVAWYTVRTRIQMSQVILGLFSYVLVLLLENVFSMAGVSMQVPKSGMIYALYLTLSVVVGREIIRLLSG